MLRPIAATSRSSIAPPRLEPGKPDPPAGPAAVLGVRPVAKGRDQVGDPRGVGLLGAGPPPRRNLVFGPVPLSADGRQVPCQRRDRRVGRPGVQVGLDLRKRPVVGEPAGAKMLGDQRPLAAAGGLDLEPEAARNPPFGDGERLPAADHRQPPRPWGQRSWPANWTAVGPVSAAPRPGRQRSRWRNITSGSYRPGRTTRDRQAGWSAVRMFTHIRFRLSRFAPAVRNPCQLERERPAPRVGQPARRTRRAPRRRTG
jgi:hypothetical protein